MAGKKTENTKKAAGNAKKAEAAAAKAAVEQSKKDQAEAEDWGKGAKSNAKKDAAEAKKQEQARKKAEKDALLAEEEKSLKSAKTGTAKTATKKTRGTLDMGALDDDTPAGTAAATAATGGPATLNASGIDNALDAMSLDQGGVAKVERHPERRYKAAYAVYEARRMPELEAEATGLRRNQRVELIRKEFEKHESNPFNQVTARFDAGRDEVRNLQREEREKVEERLAAK